MITAGDWIVSEIAQDEILIETVVDGSKRGTICGVWPWTDDARGKAEQLANANAIARLPQFIGMARRVVEAFEGTESALANDARALLAEIQL